MDNDKEALDLGNIATFFITPEGDIVVISTKEISKAQEKTITKVIVAANKDSSFIFKIFLFLEIAFQKLSFGISKLFR
jgi:hypothetical protein